MRPTDRRLVPAALLVSAALILSACTGGDETTGSAAPAVATTSAAPSGAATPVGTPTATPTADPGPPSEDRKFESVTRLTGGLTPKSVVASSTGMVVAQNMIYTHTVSVYDQQHELVDTIQDTVNPADFGYPQWDDDLTGGPVEASFSPDGEHVWVSNYKMTGPDFRKPGDDICSPAQGFDRSFLYRISTKTWKVDGIVLVGSVPKYVDAAPDGKTVLVTNWCSYDMSVVDVASMKEVARIPIGRYPRGIAVNKDSTEAYVAVMGSSNVLAVDLKAIAAGDRGKGVTRVLSTPGRGPRHLNLSPDGKYLYATLNQVGVVAKIEVATGKVLDKVATGSAPRSSVLSPDGTALFVVNYESGTVSRVRTSDMKVLESEHVDHHPIGITYNPATDEVWVCSYIGVINVFKDAA